MAAFDVYPRAIVRTEHDMTPVRIAASILAFLSAAACEPGKPDSAPGSDGSTAVPELDGGPLPEADQASDLAGGPIDLLPSDDPAESPCALFSATEIGAFLGRVVAEGREEDESCVWEAAGKDGFARVQIAPASRHAPPASQAGFEAIAAIGEDGYVVPVADGYAGGALDGDDAVLIAIGSVLNGRDIAAELLRQSVERND